MTSKAMEHLNRPYGYEIATLLMFRSLKHSEIIDELHIDDVKDKEVTRITDRKNNECDIDVIKPTGTHDEAPFTLNRDLFSQGEFGTIREMAHLRRMDNDPEITREDFDGNLESEAHHIDHHHKKSRFVSYRK